MDFMTFTLNTPMFDFLVLSIIAEGDAYGYQISQIIKRVSDTKDSALYPICLLYTSPSPRDRTRSRMPSSA